MDISKIISSLSWNKKIEVFRAINDWTQEEAARKCKTNQKMYWSWEKGKNYPRKDSQISIAKAYGVDVRDIFPI
ncbi:transcriptional regulator [Clostridium tetani]|uniref:helix-turn-helix transcriptional regulator n=1 Tax=Clostridium tetani TaxID=1513 RepID=UPI000E1687A4|nr:helix-turn-helix transcriptional regulator [Clostridium tetani]RXI57069.1 XRE family transcriptional regulator [Clostridium tetani]RXI78446.1 XRE family transcriptional regulator [Clostridium tetani]SUY56799.1 transcriptional regulator [Clostridium tetani]SUY80097.1 transcriptional regulator [Clostridium tetani]BDR78908.1 hypothetical protein K154307017_18410 [Clostridium tetani]